MSQEEVQATESVESGSVDTGADNTAPTQEAAPTEQGEQAAGEPQGYQPTLKFKVMDEEHEFHPSLAQVIKDQETEKYYRELYEKAYGLDHVKPKYEKVKSEYESYKQKWDPVAEDIERLKEYLGNQDYGSFFNTFGLTDEQIMEYAINKLQYYEMTPEQRKAHDIQQQRNQELANLRLENNKYKQRMEQETIHTAAQTLEQTIQSPEVSVVASEFDQRAGQPGSFRNAVITYAQGVFASTGRDLSVPEAVQSFIKTFGLTAAANAAPQAQGQAASQQVPQARAKTLPSINGNGVAPVKSKVTSIKDIYAKRDELLKSGY